MRSVKIISLASVLLSFPIVTAVQPASARHQDKPPLQHVWNPYGPRSPYLHHQAPPRLQHGVYVTRPPHRTHPRTHPVAYRPYH
jgi:hypothetical protein